ncbi:MAG TPA: cholesterol oxidase substrate-binding domain-containing protein, partial [Coleofasciculaceae cyanobacterium]
DYQNDENEQWRMRAVGGRYDSFHKVLIDWKLQKVGLMGTHCWLPIIGDNNLDVFFDPGCLDLLYQTAYRSANTAKACYVKLPSSQDVAVLDLPDGYPPALKTAGAKLAIVSPGSSMLEFSEGLANQGYYLCIPTAPGILSVGGVVAIAGHGSGVPSAASDSLDIPDYAFSTVSNQMVWMDVIAYNSTTGQYELTRVSRNDPPTSEKWAAMACSLGKCFSVRMAFLVYPLQKGNLKARILQLNHFIQAGTLLGADGTAEGSLQYLAQNYGGLEPIQFPTYSRAFYEGKDFVWTKTWSYHPTNSDFTTVKVFHQDPITKKTVASNLDQSWYSEVNQPFNYPATAGISCTESVAIIDGVKNLPATTPLLTGASAATTGKDNVTGGGYSGIPVGNGKTGFWSDKNLNVYYFVEPDTLRAYDWSYGVLCHIEQIQGVVNTFHTVSLQLLQEFENKGDYPLMTAGEVRLVGLDSSPANGWSYPALSTASPGLLPTGIAATNMVCVYLSWLSSAVQPTYWEFCSQLEDLLFFGANPALGDYPWAPEWSKAWGCNQQGPYQSDAKLARVRANFNQGANTDGFAKVANILQAADPNNLFYSRMIGRLFKS